MTTEEKAKAYAENLPATAATWGMRKSVIANAYLTGAVEALASQWKDPKVELPEEDTLVVAHSPNGRIDLLTFHDDEFIDKLYHTHCVDYWLPIPTLKGGEA